MKIILFALFLVVCSFLSVTCWIEQENRDALKLLGHPKECFGSTYNIGYFKMGEKKRVSDQCAIGECLENGNVRYTGCIPVYVEPPCTVEEGILSKPYPDCCFEIICPVLIDAEAKKIEKLEGFDYL